MATVYDQARFNLLYSDGYNASLYRNSMFGHRAFALVNQNNSLQVSPGNSVAIVGGGFGYLAQYLIENYQFNANNLRIYDNSPYIAANIATEQSIQSIRDAFLQVDILSGSLIADIGGNSQRSQWIITEDVIGDMQDDTEINLFIAQCNLIQRGSGGIVHMVTPISDGADPAVSINWKTIGEWQAYAPSHYWYDINAQVLLEPV